MAPELGVLLGQDSVSADLLTELEQDDVRAVRLTGPSGSGKTHVAQMVAALWCADGGACVVGVGDDEHYMRELFPLLSGLSQTPPDWAGLASLGARSAVQIADNTTGGGLGAGTTIFDILTAAFRQKTERTLKPYSAPERDVILDLRRLARFNRLLLVADNSHWWDADSLRLLGDLLSDQLRSALPQLEHVKALIVDTAAEQRIAAPDAFDALLKNHVSQVHRLTRCSPELFPAILNAFGVETDLPAEVMADLFSVTHGHLKLVQQVAALAEQGGLTSIVESIDDDYLASLVAARFASLGSFRPEVTELLVRAAVLGLSFTERDLVCIAESDKGGVRSLLEHAEGIGFMEKEADRIGFSHDVIRAAILARQAPSTLRGLYGKLGECLAILRPSDYAARAHALTQADDPEGAREMLALSSVAQIRRGVPASRVVSRVRTRLPDDVDLIAYLETIATGYAAVDSGDYLAALGQLRVPVAGESKVMAAERNYLIAICTMLQHTAAGAEEARSLLASWLGDLESEVGLELRFLLLLQQAQLVSELFDAAWDTERMLERRLLDRRRYDAEASVMLQVQNRRAGAINAPEAAEPRITAAVEYFRRGTGDRNRDRLELFRSLTNLAAIQLRLGKDASAYARAREAERLVIDSPDLFGRVDVLASNLVLAGLRCGEIPLAEAIEMQETVISGGDTEDGFLERCNLSALLLLASRDDEAGEEVRCLCEELKSHQLEEGYLVYYCSALAVAAAALRGDGSEALRLHRELGSFVEGLRWPSAPHVRRRHDLLERVLPELDVRAARTAVDRVLLDRWPEEIGEPWAYYGRLIPCVELSFWSDS